MVQKLSAFLQDGVSDHDHVFCQVLYQRQEAAFRVEPCVCPQFLLVRLQALDNPRYAKLIVALRTIQGSGIFSRYIIMILKDKLLTCILGLYLTFTQSLLKQKYKLLYI